MEWLFYGLIAYAGLWLIIQMVYGPKNDPDKRINRLLDRCIELEDIYSVKSSLAQTGTSTSAVIIAQKERDLALRRWGNQKRKIEKHVKCFGLVGWHVDTLIENRRQLTGKSERY